MLAHFSLYYHNILTPDRLERYLKLGEVVKDVLEIRPVVVPPTTLVISKSPPLLEGRETNDALLV